MQFRECVNNQKEIIWHDHEEAQFNSIILHGTTISKRKYVEKKKLTRVGSLEKNVTTLPLRRKVCALPAAIVNLWLKYTAGPRTC